MKLDNDKMQKKQAKVQQEERTNLRLDKVHAKTGEKHKQNEHTTLRSITANAKPAASFRRNERTNSRMDGMNGKKPEKIVREYGCSGSGRLTMRLNAFAW